MGHAVAAAAARAGATVTLCTTRPERAPAGVEVVAVDSAQEMHDAVLARADDADAIVMAAAVADFRPSDPAAGKIKKQDGVPNLRLERTTDILATLGANRDGRALVGFAAETAGPAGADGLEAEGRRKLEAKGVDLLVVNEVGREGTGFGSDTDVAAILARDGTGTALREWTKAELAEAICDRLAALVGSGGGDGGR